MVFPQWFGASGQRSRPSDRQSRNHSHRRRRGLPLLSLSSSSSSSSSTLLRTTGVSDRSSYHRRRNHYNFNCSYNRNRRVIKAAWKQVTLHRAHLTLPLGTVLDSNSLDYLIESLSQIPESQRLKRIHFCNTRLVSGNDPTQLPAPATVVVMEKLATFWNLNRETLAEIRIGFDAINDRASLHDSDNNNNNASSQVTLILLQSLLLSLQNSNNSIHHSDHENSNDKLRTTRRNLKLELDHVILQGEAIGQCLESLLAQSSQQQQLLQLDQLCFDSCALDSDTLECLQRGLSLSNSTSGSRIGHVSCQPQEQSLSQVRFNFCRSVGNNINNIISDNNQHSDSTTTIERVNPVVAAVLQGLGFQRQCQEQRFPVLITSNSRLQTLDLSAQELTWSCLPLLAQVLYVNPCLEQLWLACNFQLFQQHSQRAHPLAVNDGNTNNNNGDDDDMGRMMSPFQAQQLDMFLCAIASHGKLCKLDLSYCNMSNEVARALLQTLAEENDKEKNSQQGNNCDCRYLQELWLWGNDALTLYSPRGCGLADCLPRMKHIVTLGLPASIMDQPWLDDGTVHEMEGLTRPENCWRQQWLQHPLSLAFSQNTSLQYCWFYPGQLETLDIIAQQEPQTQEQQQTIDRFSPLELQVYLNRNQLYAKLQGLNHCMVLADYNHKNEHASAEMVAMKQNKLAPHLLQRLGASVNRQEQQQAQERVGAAAFLIYTWLQANVQNFVLPIAPPNGISDSAV